MKHMGKIMITLIIGRSADSVFCFGEAGRWDFWKRARESIPF
jgi:hypothetical protein